MNVNFICRVLLCFILRRRRFTHSSLFVFVIPKQERVEENLYIQRKEKEQLKRIREQMEERNRMRQQLWDQMKLENAMEDLKYILRDEKVSPEALKHLAEWKTFGI